VLDQGLVDRLVRGRLAIALVAFALIGIVTIQLGQLKLSGEIGRALGQAQVLQRESATLGIENSELAAGNRIESRAAALGMELVPSGALRFLAADAHSDPARALSALSSPIQHSAASSEAQGTGSQAGSEATGSSSAAVTASAAPPGGESAATSSGAAASGGEASRAGTAEATSGSGEPASAATAASGAGASAGTGTSSGEAAAAGPGGGTQASSAG